jgi:hypothetical protein
MGKSALLIWMLFLAGFPAVALSQDPIAQQEISWKGYHLRLVTSPAEPSSKEPVEIVIRSQKNGEDVSFPGAIRLSLQDLSHPNSSLYETNVNTEDFVGSGVTKISHPFTTPGLYEVIVTFTDSEGEMNLLRGRIQVAPRHLFSPGMKRALIYGTVGFVFLLTFFYSLRRLY